MSEFVPATYSSARSAFGRLLVAAHDGKLVRVALRQTEHAFLDDLHRQGFAPVRDDRAMAPLMAQLLEYLDGSRSRIDADVELTGVTPFTRAVLEETRKVPAGSVVSYGEIARRVGHPRASRAVGNALASNPVAIVVPCHRVVAARGRMGGYTGGLDIKLRLLALEGATLGV